MEEELLTVPLFRAPTVVFPGCLQPLNIFELWAEQLVHFVLNKVPKQRLFVLLHTPQPADVGENEEQSNVGVLLRAVNAYYPNKPGGRTIVLAKALHRVQVKNIYPHQVFSFSMAVVAKYLDYEEETKLHNEGNQLVDNAAVNQLPPLVDDDDDTTGKGTQAENERDQRTIRNEKDQEESIKEARSVLEAFIKRFRYNSMWKVIKQKLSQDEPPLDDPPMLSFWMAATLPPAAWNYSEQEKARMLKERRWEERLKRAVALFKKYPPVRNSLAQSSDAAHHYDRGSAFALSNEEDSQPSVVRLTPLKEKCIEFICTDEQWRSPLISEKLRSLPIEIVERILLYLHRTERFTIEVLEFFKGFPVETLFLSNIRAMEDSWLEVLKSYSSLTYLDLSLSYRITDTGLSECLKSLPQLRSLFVDRCKRITDVGLAPLATHCTSLRRLHVGGTLITYYTLSSLTCLENLQDVSVNGTRFPDQAMWPLIRRIDDPDKAADQKLRLLTSFEAAKTMLRNEGAVLLKDVGPTLHTLNLSFNPGITDWSFLSSLTSLTHLDLSLNVGFSDQFAAEVGKLTSLTHLNLSKTELTDRGVLPLLDLTRLRSLDLSKTAITHRELGPGLSHLSGLTSLSLQYTAVGGKLSRYLLGLEQLTSLKTTGCTHFGNKGLLILTQGRHPHLTSLDVGGESTTDAGLVHIGELTALRSFSLWTTKVTTQGADLVQQLTGLVLDDSMNTTKGTYLFVRK